MGSPTSDDDPTRRVGGPGGWQQPGQGGGYPPPGQGGGYPPPGQGASYPPPGQGGGTPPPGQSGYPGQDQPTTRFPQGDDERSRTAQFPQPGGYPQAGPGGAYPQQGQQGMYGPQGPYPQQGQYPPGQYPPPGTGGPGGPPPERSRRGLITALIAGLVILAGVGVALIFAFTRDDGDTVSADPSTSTSAPPASSPSSSPSSAPSSTPETTSEPPPTDTAGDRTDELLAVVPPDFTDCAGADLAGDGDVAAVDCGASTTQPGPTAASFYLYDDTGTLDDVFDEDAGDIDPMPDGEDCTTAQGRLPWDTADGDEGGDVACTVTDDGLLIAWTDREFGIEGVITAPGSTQEDLAALAEWWRGNSDFQR